jgi:WD40 repeat protein
MKLLQTILLPYHSDAVESIDLNVSEKLVACGMYQLIDEKRIGCIQVYIVNTENNLLLEKCQITTSGIFDLKWKNCNMLLAACADGSLSMFDSKLNLLQSLVPSQTPCFCLALDIVPERYSKPWVATSYSNGTISVFDLNTEQVVTGFLAHVYNQTNQPAEVWTVCFQNDNLLFSGADDGRLKLWDLRDSSLLSNINSAHNDSAGICSTHLHPTDDTKLFSGGYDSCINIWDLRNMKYPLKKSKNLNGGIWRIKPSLNYLLCACMRGGFNVIDINTLDVISKYTENENSWEDLAYGVTWISPTILAGCSFYDKKLRLFEL